MYIHIKTKRLRVRPVSLSDAAFMFDLVNSEGWLRFIGDRNVHDVTDAERYIQAILDRNNAYYNVIELNESDESVGVVTLLQREDESFPDIGFALLSKYENNGYALEASKAYLQEIIAEDKYDNIIGITLPTNQRSISLLQKIGMTYQFDQKKEDQVLSYYSLKTLMTTKE